MKQRLKPFWLCLLLTYSHVLPAQMASDTIHISHERVQQIIKWNYRYDQTLVLKIFLANALFDGKFKRRDNGTQEIYLSFEEALDVIKRIDNLTLGIPKIVYLVGWQYNGHDSKYPAFFEGNESLKRSGDSNALESIRWLMKAARKHNTTVSLHLNMFDAYEDSPLWNEYVQKDIISKDKNGRPLPAEVGYPISYAQEWKTGMAQKRIDTICKLLPLAKAGTIHIDAFHTWPPMPVVDSAGNYTINLDKRITSPYLTFTPQDEAKAQQNIFKYWASKGIDVTSEGVAFLRETSFEGYQPMGWWLSGGLEFYTRWPSSIYSGGVDRSKWGRLFGTSMHGEDIIKKDKEKLSRFKEQFCINTAIWMYLNRLKRMYLIHEEKNEIVQFSENVRTSLNDGVFTLTEGETVLAQDDNVLIPVTWMKQPALLAYSKNGYENKQWSLPTRFRKWRKVKLYEVNMQGKVFMQVIQVDDNKIQLTVKEDQMILLQPY